MKRAWASRTLRMSGIDNHDNLKGGKLRLINKFVGNCLSIRGGRCEDEGNLAKHGFEKRVEGLFGWVGCEISDYGTDDYLCKNAPETGGACILALSFA